MKVCWLASYFSPYDMKLLNIIGSKIDLSVVMLGGADDNRNSEWKLTENHSFKFYQIDKNYNKLIKQLADENDIFIDSMYSTKYGIIGVNEFKKRNKKVIMQADGGIAIDRGLINHIISFVMNRHDYFLSPGPFCDEYYKFYKVKQDKIHHYRFSSLTNEDIYKNKELINQKDELRKALNVDDKFTILSVGQPIKRKGFDILLDAYIKTGLTDKINLYVVGGNPQEEVIKIVKDYKLHNVHFVGLISSEELKKYYAMSDLFVLTTRYDIWGLVINEAMSFGLPTITSNKCGAGMHFKMVSDCGIICDVEDRDAYSKEIIKLFNDKELEKELSKKSLETIEEYTIENSSQDILNILNEL